MLDVRPALPADADAIGHMHVRSSRAAYTGLLPDAAFDDEAQRRMWRDGLASERPPGSATFVAVLDDAVVGVANVRAARGEASGTGELTHIYLDPDCWGHGVGRALLARAEESLRESGFREAVLWVVDGNERAERFYRAAGWALDGGRVLDEPGGARVPRVRYRKALE
jgi:GNAT superfamily N-acetyltransferase